MKVLVLGGTGAIGKHTVQLLSQKGVEIFVTSRKNRYSCKNVTFLEGNAHELDFLSTILHEQWDTIIDFMVYTTKSFQERIELLLNSTTQYIFLSTARVYANSTNPIDEDYARLLDSSSDREFLSTDDYSLSKARQEDLLIKSKQSNWTIIRPYITYSENRLQLGIFEKEEWLYRALKGRTIIFPYDLGSKITTLTYGLDVSKGIVSLIGNSIAMGETYHISTEEAVSWNDILDIYLKILQQYLGYKPRVLLVKSGHIYKLHFTKYSIKYDRLYNRQFNNSKISQFVGVKDFLKVEEGLKKCMEEYLKNANWKKINWKKEALKDKDSKEHTPISEIEGIKQKLKYIKNRYFWV